MLFISHFQDYIFALLTGYCDPPEGIELGEGQAYNPYFPGGAIGMAQQLYNEGVEYDDGKSDLFSLSIFLCRGSQWCSG